MSNIKFVYYQRHGRMQPAIIYEDIQYLGGGATPVVTHNITEEEASKGLDWLIDRYPPNKDSSPQS